MSGPRAMHVGLAWLALFGLAACRTAGPQPDAGEPVAPTPVAPTPGAPIPGAAETEANARVAIEVRLTALDPSRGSGPIQVALWNSESTFMRAGNWVRGMTIPIVECGNPVLFTDLPPGTYAVSAFHDTQSAGTLRRGTFGIPIDPWAVSNGGSPLLPPSWRRAKFTVKDGTATITLDFHAAAERAP